MLCESFEGVDGRVELAGRPGATVLHEDLRHKWNWNVEDMRASTRVLGVHVTAMKQFGAFLTSCNPRVEE